MFWDNFEKLCAGIGKSPNAVAKELVIPSGSVTAWKKGTTPRNGTLKKISDYFETTIDALTGETDKKEKPSAQMSEELDPVTEELFRLLGVADEETKRQILDYALYLKSKNNTP